MNKKFLFGMLVGGALLTACTADDLNTAPVAQEVNPSAPVFTVYLDDYQNRATMVDKDANGNALWQLRFQPGDLMSLYHGVQVDETNAAADLATFAGWQNAIYTGTLEANGTAKFTTPAVINAGKAIMIYPGDTAFYNSTNTVAPAIKIDSEQTAKTKEYTPYMSEVITIDPYNSNIAGHEAGYGREYEIALKRVGTTLFLHLDFVKKLTLPEDVTEPITVEKVSLEGTDMVSGQGMFTTAISIKGLEDAAVTYVAPTPTTAGVHTHWLNQSELAEVKESTSTISTEDVGDNIATFTLLPTLNENIVLASGSAGIELKTNYGKVTITEATTIEDSNKLWYGAKSGAKNTESAATIRTGLTALTKGAALWDAALSGTFYNGTTKKGENIAGYLNRYLDVDQTTLNMDGLHIKNETHLKNAIKVYNSLPGTKPAVTFLLDGADGKFVMHKEAWEAVVKQLDTKNNALKFKACREDGEKCFAIQLVQEGDDIEEVPELRFETIGGSPADELNIELIGKWKYESQVTTTTVSAKNIAGVDTLVVNSGTELTMKNHVNLKTGSLQIENYGEATTSGRVYLELNMSNYNTINVAEDTELDLNGSAVLNNMATQAVSTTTDPVTGLTEGAGVINVEKGAMLAILGDTQTAKINNYGIINQNDETADIAISTNATSDAKTGEEFDKTNNAIGTINLYSATSGERVSIKAVKENNRNFTKYTGFLKIKVSNSAATEDAFGPVANYVILTGSCNELKIGSVTDNGTTTSYLPSTIKFIEIDSSEEVKLTSVSTTDKFNNLWGILVPAGKKMRIPNGVELTVLSSGCMYVKGDINNFGVMNLGTVTFEGYFGGTGSKSTGDGLNIRNNGKIN